MLNAKKITWCENWIKATFKKENEKYKQATGKNIGGIERNFFFELAAKSGLYEPDTYGSEMSQALSRLHDTGFIKFGTRNDIDGNFAYYTIELA